MGYVMRRWRDEWVGYVCHTAPIRLGQFQVFLYRLFSDTSNAAFTVVLWVIRKSPENSSQVFAFRITWNFEWTTWWFKWIKIVQGQERLFLFWQNALFIWRGGFSPRSYSPTEAHLCSVITGPIVICTSELNYEKVILICFALQEWHEAVSSRDRSKSTGGGGEEVGRSISKCDG